MTIKNSLLLSVSMQWQLKGNSPLLPKDCREFYQMSTEGFLMLPEVPWGALSPLSRQVHGFYSQNVVGISAISGHLQSHTDTPGCTEHERTHLKC